MILVVENDRALSRLLVDILRIHGHRVLATRSGADAIAAAGGLRPDVILMDAHLERECVVSVASRLREISPLVVMSGPDTDEECLREATGARELLPRTFGLQELLACVRRSAAGSRLSGFRLRALRA